MDNLYVIKQKTWSFRFFRFLVLKRKRFFWFQRSHSCSFLLHLLFSLSNHQEIWKKLSSFCCHFVNLNFMHLFFVLSFSCSLFQLFPRDLVHPFSHGLLGYIGLFSALLYLLKFILQMLSSGELIHLLWIIYGIGPCITVDYVIAQFTWVDYVIAIVFRLDLHASIFNKIFFFIRR